MGAQLTRDTSGNPILPVVTAPVFLNKTDLTTALAKMKTDSDGLYVRIDPTNPVMSTTAFNTFKTTDYTPFKLNTNKNFETIYSFAGGNTGTVTVTTGNTTV